MIIEIAQFFDILHGNFHYLIIHFLIFLLLTSIVRKLYSFRYHSYMGELIKKEDVSAIVPVYNENPKILEQCLGSLKRNNPGEIIVLVDVPTQEIKDITKTYADKVFFSEKRRGKRVALGEGFKESTGNIVMFVDSDMILADNCLDELIKPFDNNDVGAVSTVHGVYPTGKGFGAYISWQYSRIIELNREINDKALDGHLIVVDGRCNAYRSSVLETYINDFLNEKCSGKPCEAGDDRYLTYRLNYDGWRTVVQTTAKGDTAAPETFWKFVKQQLRWAKSGRRFFLKELRHNFYHKVGGVYAIHSATYYLAAISFTLAIFIDLLFCIDLDLRYPLWSFIILVPLGTTLVNMIRQSIVLGRKANLRNSFWYGMIGLFILYPMNVYAWFVFRGSKWYTRGKEIEYKK